MPRCQLPAASCQPQTPSGSSRAAAGYSVVELITTIAIIVTVSTLSLMSYRTAQVGLALRQASEELAGALRLAQSHALSATCQSPWCPPRPPAYGVHVVATSPPPPAPSPYEVFVDVNGNSRYDAGTDVVLLGPAQVPAAIAFSPVAVRDTGAPCTPGQESMNVTFAPPRPATAITKDNGSSCAKVCFFLTLGGQTRSVTVTGETGLIETAVAVTPGVCEL
jgi:Tfp pilus assembly protein FimT